VKYKDYCNGCKWFYESQDYDRYHGIPFGKTLKCNNFDAFYLKPRRKRAFYPGGEYEDNYKVINRRNKCKHYVAGEPEKAEINYNP